MVSSKATNKVSRLLKKLARLETRKASVAPAAPTALQEVSFRPRGNPADPGTRGTKSVFSSLVVREGRTFSQTLKSPKSAGFRGAREGAAGGVLPRAGDPRGASPNARSVRPAGAERLASANPQTFKTPGSEGPQSSPEAAPAPCPRPDGRAPADAAPRAERHRAPNGTARRLIPPPKQFLVILPLLV